MKKWYIILAVFLLVIIFGIGRPVVNGAIVNSYFKEMTLHSAAHDAYKDTKGVTADGSFRISDANVYYFIKAVTRTGLIYQFFKPNTVEMPYVTMTFHDGAEVQIFDAGETQKNKDLAYIFYTYNGKSKYFKLEGYDTFVRASQCAGKGFSGENRPIS